MAQAKERTDDSLCCAIVTALKPTPRKAQRTPTTDRKGKPIAHANAGACDIAVHGH